MKQKALIIGGGIAGPATALFLNRAGIAAEVYEARSATDEDAGFFLNIAPNGMNVLKTLGVDRQLEPDGFPATGITFFNRKGKQIGGLVVKWAELHRVLREEMGRQDIPLRFDKRFQGVTLLPGGGVRVQFEDGTTAQGALLLCCDGVYSRARRLVFPDAPKPSYLGMIDCGGFAYLPELRHLSGPQTMTFGKRAFFGYVVKPSGGVYWFSNVPWPKEPIRDGLSAYADEAWKERLLELHADDPDPISQIIQATPVTAMGRWPLRDLPPLPIWHKGPVCILGDAAHATSPAAGQGASMALEDAVVLGKCLRDVAEVEKAFAAFQSLRKARVEQVVREARRNSNRKIPHPIMGWVLDLLLPTFLKAGAHMAEQGYAYEVSWDEPVRKRDSNDAPATA